MSTRADWIGGKIAGDAGIVKIWLRYFWIQFCEKKSTIGLKSGWSYKIASLMESLTIQQSLDLAVQHHQAGRLREAEQIYRQVLAQWPEHPGVMLNLGVIAGQTGRNDVALDLIGQVITRNPNFAEAHFNLGVALKDKSQLDRAIAAYQRAVALKPDYVQAYFNLGNAWKDKRQLDQAIAAYSKAAALNPNHFEAYNNLGIALVDKGQIEEAIAAYRKAIALKADFAEAHNNLGIALREKERFDESVAAFQRAIAINPNYAEAHYNLGIVLKDKGEVDGAIAAYQNAIVLQPNYAEAHDNLGNMLRDKGEVEEAIAAYRRAIVCNPNLAPPHYNLALSLLLRGDWEEGWKKYEWRWKTELFQLHKREFPQPVWDGSNLNGRTILLHAEQGFGDAIQFIRYVPLVAGRGGRVVVEVRPQLLRLMRQLPGVEQWIPSDQALRAFDVRCSIMSLPYLFETTVQSIPVQEPLRADADLVQAWRGRIESQSAGLKVGLAWAGSPTFKADRTRSISLDRLEPLARARDVTFYSVQKGAAAAQADKPPGGLRLVKLSDELHDFADTAAVMSLMDLVITTDTSVAHLAGAMGRPVWVMLQFMPDWRWLLYREDCPWYPTMRLFRQTRPGDWAGVIARVAEALSDFCNQSPS
jgi:tetratricopeptide (TPR) repeat protein